MNTTLTPRLVVSDVDAAISFYESALSATLLERYAEPSGHVVHAALDVDGGIFSLTQAKKSWGFVSPEDLGGTPVLVYLLTDAVDALVERFLRAGGEAVIALDDRYYGHREGRFCDPFGHLWILSQVIETLTPEQVNERMR